jgi:hypothetical protein
MGKEIERPRVAGVGERPTTPKPLPPHSIFADSLQGKQPTNEKPVAKSAMTAQTAKA